MTRALLRTVLMPITAGLIATATGAAPEPGSNETVPDPSTAAGKIDRYLSAMEALGFSGAIIVADGGEVALRKGYGLADRESRLPYTPDTVQTHGSITKQMTGAAILLLESRGKLGVEDPITKYFEDVPEDKRGITLHQLLTHSAGFPGGIGPDNEPIGADDFAEQALAAPLSFEPGTEYDYSNVGFSLLGIIVENVSGKGYEQFLRDELLLPAGLEETGYLLPDWDGERLAVGYQNGEQWGQVYRRNWRDDGPGWHLRANGGLHTTVDDMHRWLATVRGKGPLPAEAAERWTTGYVDEGGGDSKYGYGWAVHDSPLGRMVAHNGGNGIFSADFVWIPEKDFFLYIQGNTSIIRAAQLREALLSAAFDPGFAMPPRVAAASDVDPGRAERRAGHYAFDQGGSIELISDDIRLIATLAGQQALDAVFGHGPEQRQRFADLNEQTLAMVGKLREGREDAMEGLVGADEDAAARARSMLEVIERGGDLQSIRLVGSIENLPGSRYADYGPWTTFVRADFGGRVQMWGVLWREDGTYRGTAIGPLSDAPSLTLVPTGQDRYTAVRTEPPWNTVDVRHEDDCLIIGELRACQ